MRPKRLQSGGGKEVDGVNRFGFPVFCLHEGVGGWLGCTRRLGLRELPHSMFLRKVALEVRTRLVCLRLLVPLATCVGEVARDKDEVVICRHDILQRIRDLYGVGEVNGRLDLLDD